MLKVLGEFQILTSRTNNKFLLAYIRLGEKERIWTDPGNYSKQQLCPVSYFGIEEAYSGNVDFKTGSTSMWAFYIHQRTSRE